jgi:hypothetical protein
MRLLSDRLEEGYHNKKDDIITLVLALQHQNYILGNSITNLVQHWPNENHLFINTSDGLPKKV